MKNIDKIIKTDIRTPWSNKSWRRLSQLAFPELPLKMAMRKVAFTYAALIGGWSGDWVEAKNLFLRRAKG